MGGDGGLTVSVPAALQMADQAQIALVGDADQIRAALARAQADRPGAQGRRTTPDIIIVHASEQLAPGDSLVDVLRHRPDSSMRQALKLHATGAADAVVSGGDTAALMALARQLLGMLPGALRPAICKPMQGVAGLFWMLDLGANVDCSPLHLYQFARMGDALARTVGGLESPRIALLNIGTEPHKGPRSLHEAAALLAADTGLQFIGYIEGNTLFSDVADVVVTDGFSGNIALKSVEGAAWMAGHLLRRWFDSLGFIEQAGVALARAKLDALRRELNPQSHNGASFVGLNGVVVKSHGAADVAGFASAIAQALREVRGGLRADLESQFGAGPAARSAEASVNHLLPGEEEG
jgi:glycerol-3-phosphate acyltransferase PlsX